MNSTSKIENTVITALRMIVDQHPTMEYNINSLDKEMSWDGYFMLYKDDSETQSKDNFDARVCLQLKGHDDEKQKYVNKKRITYPVDIDDLEAYGSEKGVLYFQMFIYKGQVTFFYKSLYPSAIADYLERAKKKGNRTAINVTFTKMKPDPYELYAIAKQFDHEARKQGTIANEIVQDRITVEEFSKIKEISWTSIGTANPQDMFEKIKSGDICLYGKFEGDKYERPIVLSPELKMYLGKHVHQPVMVGNKVFYESFELLKGDDDEEIIRFSDNLSYSTRECKVSFRINSTIKDLYVDALFVLELNKNLPLTLFNTTYKVFREELPPDLEEQMHFFVDLYETLEMIGFDTNASYSTFSDEDRLSFINLVNLRLGNFNNRIKDEYSRFNWKICGKNYPLLLIKRGDTIELVDSIYTKKYVMFIPCNKSPDERGYQVPLFPYHDISLLSNLYKYDYALLREQIEGCAINKETAGALTECILILINVYDMNYNVELLNLAEYFLDRIREVLEYEVYIINKLQIKKRRERLELKDVKTLYGIDSERGMVQFCKNVLLEESDKAKLYYEKLSPAEKIDIEKMPIFNLYKMI